MTGFCARTLPAAAVALAALAATPTPAWAQAWAQAEPRDAPVTLAPPSPLAPPPAAAPSEPESPPADKAEGVGISVDTLGEIDSNSVGLLDEGSGGLGIDMWQGTPYGLVRHMLPRLPAPVRSVVARDLARRLVLSTAKPPVPRSAKRANAAKAGSKAKAGPSLLALRTGWLMAAGDVESALSLLKAAPQRIDEKAIERARLDTALLTNDNAGACARVRGGTSESLGLLWRKSLVFCQILAGDRETATIGAALLAEQNVDDPAFFALVRVLTGEKDVEVTLPAQPTALHLAMVRAARVRIGPEILEGASPAILRAVAFSPNAGIDTRLEAAERSEAIGALDAAALSELYGAVNFPPDDVAKALSAAEKLPGPRGRALLFHAARLQRVPAARAEILAKAFALAHRDGRGGEAARVFLPILGELPPRDDLAWFARDAGAVLFAAGRFARARKWLALARANPDAGASDAETPTSAPAAPAGAPADAGTAGPEAGAARATPTIARPPARPADVALWALATLAAIPIPQPAPVAAADVAAGAAAAPATPDGAANETVVAGPETPPPSGPAPVVVRPLAPSSAVQASPLDTAVMPAPLNEAAAKREEERIEPPEIPFDRAAFARWWRAEGKTPVGRQLRARRAELLLALLEALGVDVPAAVWVRTVAEPRAPGALPAIGVVRAMEEAAAAGRTAETVLLAVAAVGDGAPEALDPGTVAAVIRALRAVGFGKDARALALEIAFAARL